MRCFDVNMLLNDLHSKHVSIIQLNELLQNIIIHA
jgi:hypothetical protein